MSTLPWTPQGRRPSQSLAATSLRSPSSSRDFSSASVFLSVCLWFRAQMTREELPIPDPALDSTCKGLFPLRSRSPAERAARGGRVVQRSLSAWGARPADSPAQVDRWPRALGVGPAAGAVPAPRFLPSRAERETEVKLSTQTELPSPQRLFPEKISLWLRKKDQENLQGVGDPGSGFRRLLAPRCGS